MAGEQNNSSVRPDESTVVQSFSADLDSMFGLGEGPAFGQLAQDVQQKQQTVTSASSELEKLEAKLRETEQRLAAATGGTSSSGRTPAPNTGAPRSSQPPNPRQATSGAAAPPAPSGPPPPPPPHQQQPQQQQQQTPPYATERPTPGSRPQQPAREDTQTLMSHVPGGLPETPRREYTGSNEYVMVDRGASR
ncbi:hypothetical protein KC343_g15072 [Hortaea werneckii]|uniref:Uncharacterized protein n=1 Tax=Hortaea werneckii TaxID=91943 RepID=A0A3M7DXD4_HORWE|nr:hypothetical protein KC352_g20449 [Hortaea werneckii]KAI7558034.1 hypothetical protein KC317_g11261 [Hortaea werneckii]KAI7601903.1 hypothetical protein KC343_g15072 [Hortaea werneckii]KAI7609347.1 hypothetical protein KC346_g9230 [Hortaea werneckii]KAI7640873.1 hypothetical protein KC319_g13769 [Hortaea werneckii]